MILLTILGALSVGGGAGLVVFYFLDANARAEGYQAGLLAGQRQSDLTHGRPVVSGEHWNRPDSGRHRSPDHNLVTRAITPTREAPAPHPR